MRKPDGSLISYMSNLVKKNGGINCAQGIPGFDPPAELIEKLTEVSAQKVHQYAPGRGVLELRKIVGVDLCGLGEENVLITNGATEAISTVYLYLKRHFKGKMTTLSFDPVYESYSNLPKIHGDRFIVQRLCENSSYDMDEFERTVKNENVSLVIISTPGNPFGRIWKRDEIEFIHSVCLKNGAFLLVDAVYSDLYFYELPYLPFDRMDENLFIVSAFSKMLSITGWRVGYVAASVNNINKIADIHDYTGLSSPSVLQVAIARYLSENALGKSYLSYLRNEIKKSFFAAVNTLEKNGFTTPQAEGGYFVWTEIPKIFDDGLDFSIKLYESRKVGVVPGIHFSENGKRMIRISIAKPVGEIVEAVKKIEEFVSFF